MEKGTPDLLFRKAVSDDVEAYLDLERHVSNNRTYSAILDRNEALRELAENEVYLAYKDGQLVGSVAYQIQGPDTAYLSGIVVYPAFQGQGIGRAMAEFRLGKVSGVQRVYLVTHPENRRAIALNESLGFRFEKRVENYFGDGEPRIVMTLKR